MTKIEQREVDKLSKYRACGADNGMIARSLSALIRCTMKASNRLELLTIAAAWGVQNHPEFIV